MGGGGAMRTTAKLAGIGFAASGIRGVPLTPLAEHSVQNALPPVSTMVSLLSSQKAKAAELAPLHTAMSWDVDDWEITDGGELIMEANDTMLRVVFDSVPTFQEAKAATTELKDAIEKIYLSSNSSECEVSSPSVSPFNTELEPKCHAIEATSYPSVPKHAFQAFQLLSASPKAQTVVACIACDPNVWNAVMQNRVIKDFFQSQQIEGTYAKMEELLDSDSGNDFANFMGIVHNLKLTVAEMVSNMSSYLQNIFGFSTIEKSSTNADVDADTSGNTESNFVDHLAMGGTFMGLVVLVVMVVILKRA